MTSIASLGAPNLRAAAICNMLLTRPAIRLASSLATEGTAFARRLASISCNTAVVNRPRALRSSASNRTLSASIRCSGDPDLALSVPVSGGATGFLRNSEAARTASSAAGNASSCSFDRRSSSAMYVLFWPGFSSRLTISSVGPPMTSLRCGCAARRICSANSVNSVLSRAAPFCC